MKITKSRLIQIIREEVELHEKYMEENTYDLDEEAVDLMQQLAQDTDKQDPNTVDDGKAFQIADEDGNGELSRKEMTGAMNVAIADKPKEPPVEKEEILFSKQKIRGKHPIVPVKDKKLINNPK